MATFIESDPSISTGTKPANAGQLIRGDEWGIDNTLSGFIIQSEDITEERITDTTQDQKGAVVSQLDYDRHWTLNLGIIGDTNATLPQPGDTTFEYAGAKWKIQSVTYTGGYASKKSWAVVAERWQNFPAQS